MFSSRFHLVGASKPSNVNNWDRFRSLWVVALALTGKAQGNECYYLVSPALALGRPDVGKDSPDRGTSKGKCCKDTGSFNKRVTSSLFLWWRV